ncbi:MAG TPA: rhomboid family intramembrane serine protease [Planctomycetota bacterium]|nr:rhomboid family intramembrane serine protease [Planctomycetota bacterium]
MVFLPLHRRVNDRVPAATIALVAVNAACFLAFYWSAGSISGLEHNWYRFGFVPSSPALPAAVTHLFIHGDWAHLAGNMLMLTLMGMNVERRLGPALYLILYFLSGFGAMGLFAALNPGLGVPLGGASGAISGVAGMYLALFARREVEVLWYVFVVAGTLKLPAWSFSLAWAAMEVVQALLFNGTSNVANWAHVGGFAVGLAGVGLLVHGLGFRGVPEILPRSPRPGSGEVFDELRYIPAASPVDRPCVILPRRFAPLPPGADDPRPFKEAQALRDRLEREGTPCVVVEARHRPDLPPLRLVRSVTCAEGRLEIQDDLGGVHRFPAEFVYLAVQGDVSAPSGTRPVVDLLVTSPWTTYRWLGGDGGAVGAERTSEPWPDMGAWDAWVQWRLRMKAAKSAEA